MVGVEPTTHARPPVYSRVPFRLGVTGINGCWSSTGGSPPLCVFVSESSIRAGVCVCQQANKKPRHALTEKHDGARFAVTAERPKDKTQEVLLSPATYTAYLILQC